MDIEQFWEYIFSEDKDLVGRAWDTLEEDERASVRRLLEGVMADPDRIADQRAAAKFAIGCIDDSGATASVATEWATGATARVAPTILPEGLLEFARGLGRQTGERLKFASGQLIASTKKDGTLVTAFDIETDREITAAIKARYPDHGVLSEEGEKVYHGQEWCWVIDPIDGTTNFTWGFPGWGVLIALLHQGQPVLGVAEFPPVGQQYYAVRGQGAWRKTETGYGDGPIHTTTDTAFTTTSLFAVGTRALNPGNPNIPCKLRLPGSAGFDFAALAGGACAGAFDAALHVWDIAALWPIVEEAGGRVITDHPGGLFPLRAGVDYNAVVFSVLGAGTPELQAEALAGLSDRFSLPSPAAS